VLVGDLNLPNVDWTAYTGPNHEVCQQFLNCVSESSYSQLVDFSTRGNNILDIMLTTDPSLFTSVKPDVPISSSDHCSIVLDMVVSYPYHCASSARQCMEPSIRYRWHKGDYESLERYLSSIDWYEVVHQNPSAMDAWSAFESILWASIHYCVPCQHRSKPKHRRPVPAHITKCTVKKRQLWRKLKGNPYNISTHLRYRECVEQWRRRMEKHEAIVEEHIVESNNVGTFFKFVNNRVSNKHKIAGVRNANGEIVDDDSSIANTFSDYFAPIAVRAEMPHCLINSN